ncbi:MAG: pilus assembly protein CpaD [Sphingomonadales bacterium 32-68-7]|nr:MAG: pilus assembly protein CpaD [Sphingomonadales bacterium 12-68-11]OYX08916.1 MAG: pilus assembly protein CpaD [Sphingomonadales bacterium 32-68-7]
MTQRRPSAFAAALAISLGLTLSGCGDMPNNRSLNSTNQPLVERRNLTLDLTPSGQGLSIPEQQRLAGWFDTMDLRYGDRIALDGQVSAAARDTVAALAGRHGLLLSEGAPVTEGFVRPGMIRVVVTRSRAFVPNCPDWSDKYATNLTNSASDNYGCSVNGNIAAMVADPEHLLKGAEDAGATQVMTSNKAIAAFREKAATAGQTTTVSSQSN